MVIRAEGQWAEKRDVTSHVSVDVAKVELRIERHRIAEAKKAALAKGLPWPRQPPSGVPLFALKWAHLRLSG
jgi:hypothetical protein